MTRWLIPLLLVANLGFFAWSRDWLAPWVAPQREPQRLQQQKDADRLRVLPVQREAGARGQGGAQGGAGGAAGEPAGAREGGAPQSPVPPNGAAGSTAADQEADAAASTSASRAAAANACLRVAGLDDERAARLAQRLGETGAKLETARTEEPGSWLVYIAPAENAREAARRMADARDKGVTDLFVIQDGQYRYGISLGIYRLEASARTAAQRIRQAGVQDVRVAPRAPVGRTTITARWPDEAGRAAGARAVAALGAQATDCR